MKAEFQKLVKKGRRPLIIIDEFHKLRGMYLPEKQKRLIKELMNFFVAMTKESHLCHVIIASSDAFFIEEVYNDSKLRKTSAFQNLDYLSYSDVKECMILWKGPTGCRAKVWNGVPKDILDDINSKNNS